MNGLVLLAGATAFSQTASPFDPLPFPSGGNGESTRPQGDPGQNQAAVGSAAAGALGAPAATFVAPSQHATPMPGTENAGASPVLSTSSVPADAQPIEGSEIVARI